MERKSSKESHSTFNGDTRNHLRNTKQGGLKSTQQKSHASPQQPFIIDVKDFQTFEPKPEFKDDTSNSSSVLVPRDYQRRLEREMHLMIDDLEMPNQSLTMSSLSQSQWQGRSTRSLISNVSNQQVGIGGPQSSVESSNLPSARQIDSNSNLTISNSQSQFGTEEKYQQPRDHEDSPDFNRAQELVSVTDDLTVSRTDLDGVTDYGGEKSYREGKLDRVQPPIVRNQNRTFADSVLDHHTINALAQPKNVQTAMKSGAVSRIDPRINGNSVIYENSKILETDLLQSKQNDRKQIGNYRFQNEVGESTDEHILDSSGMGSDIDLLTRTQISNNLGGIDPLARSRIIFNPTVDDFSQSQITVPGSDPYQNLNTKRTNNQVFKKLVDDASSLNFTPDKDSAAHSGVSIKWQLKSNQGKDNTDYSDMSQLNTDRAESQNPITQLKERIKQSNIQKRQGKTKDFELYEALETPQTQQNNYSALQRSLSDLQNQNQDLAEQNRQLAATCDTQQRQIIELQQAYQNVQNVKTGGNDLLRARALEAARSEIRELREIQDEKDEKIRQLEQQSLKFESILKLERSQSQEKTNQLELQVEKFKIMSQAVRRESEEQIEKLNEQLELLKNTREVNMKNYEFSEAQASQKIQVLETRLQQSDQLIQSRDVELQKREKSIKQVKQDNLKLETNYHNLQSELNDLQQRYSSLNTELEQIRQRNSDNNQLKPSSKNQDAKEFDQEIRRITEKHNNQLQKVTEENQKFKSLLRDKDALIRQLQHSKNYQEEDSTSQLTINEIKELLGADDSNIIKSITSLLQEVDLQTKSVEQARNSLNNNELQLQSVQQRLQQKDTELKLAVEAAKKAQQALANANLCSDQPPSNFTKNILHAKDVELQNAKDQHAESLEKVWALEQELRLCQTKLDQSTNEKHEMNRELMLIRKARNQAEQNVIDLKEKLRIELQKPQTENQSIHSIQSVDKQKYEEMITAILSLNLAEDPLNGVMKLQESFVDEYEQAMNHLDEQGKLVKNQMNHLNKQAQSFKQQIKDLQTSNEKLNKDIKTLQSKRDELFIELKSNEQTSQSQAMIIKDLEQQILLEKGKLTSEHDFLHMLDMVIESKNTNVDLKSQKQPTQNTQLFTLIMQRIENIYHENNVNEISQINVEVPNPLQDKSGKHEAFMFLSHLQSNQKDQCCQVDTENSDEIVNSARCLSHQTKIIEQEKIIADLQFDLQQKVSQLEDLRNQIMSELQFKIDELQIQCDMMRQERDKSKLETDQTRKLCERRIEQISAQNEQRVADLESDYQSKIEQDSLLQNSARSQVKTELQSQISQLKLESKRLKEEIERIKKQHQEKIKSLQLDFDQEKSLLVQTHNQDIEELKLKQKKDKKDGVEKAQQQIRSELLNKISELRNEHARLEAEWQRERSKFESIKQEQLEKVRVEMEVQSQDQIKEARAITERSCKKKMDERQQHFDNKIQEIEAKLQQTQEEHSEELKKQQRVWQQKLKEQQIMNQPRQLTSTMTQVSPAYNSGGNSRKESPQSTKQSRNISLQQSQHTECECNTSVLKVELHHQTVFIEQLKINFEQELERQEQLHLQDLKVKLNQTLKTFEQMIVLECEKILLTIMFKSQENSNLFAAQTKLNDKRNEINVLIKQLISKSQKSETKELKRSFEAVKEKISIVLTNLKSQLETKYKILQQQTSAIQIEDTQTESYLASEESIQQPRRQQLTRQSSSSADVNLTNHRSPHDSPQQPVRGSMQLMGQDRNSELKNYLDFKEVAGDQEESLIGRVAPQNLNSKGAIVVEVEKVVRDLEMLFETAKMAKFCRVILGETVQPEQRQSKDAQINFVNAYRDLLNNFFKLINNLNKASDQICQDQEVYKLRLVIVSLKQEVAQLKKEQNGVVTRSLVQQIISYHQKHFNDDQVSTTSRVKGALDALEKLYFQISKNQFKLNQLADLFTKEGQLNYDLREVSQRCEEFTSQDQFLESSFQNKYLPAEMLSPDETAHLIANVIQKMPNKNLTINSEDILRQALQIVHEQSNISMPPLQRIPKQPRIGGTIIQHPANNTIQTSTAGEMSKRSRSTNVQPHLSNMPRQMLMNSGSLYQTVEPPTHFLSHANQSRNLVSIVNDRYTCSQESAMPTSIVKVPYNQTLSQETDFLIDEGESVQINNAHQHQLDDQLANAQSNVNQLFEKIRGSKFNTLQH